MTIKAKLTFGITFLFLAFLVVGGSSLYFTLKISKQNLLIMKDNHLSIGYCENMLQAIDKIDSIQTSYLFNNTGSLIKNDLTRDETWFEQNFLKEENNITETGEKQQVQMLKNNFDKFKSILKGSMNDSMKDKSRFYYVHVIPAMNKIKTNLFSISDLNMEAIVRKNDIANSTAHHSYLVLSGITTICFLVFFMFIFGFPSYIANPIKELTQSVKEIENRNFSARMHFASNDEFGKIADAFNKMAASLEEFQDSKTKQPIYVKERMEVVLDQVEEGILLLDEHQNLLFINQIAEKLFNLNRFEALNRFVPDLAPENNLMKLVILDLTEKRYNRPESIVLLLNGKKTKVTRELTRITISKKDNELVVPIGYMILLKTADESGLKMSNTIV